MPKRILCAVDGSKVAAKAAAVAVDLASSMGANVTFLTINVVPSRVKQTVYWDATLTDAAEAQANRQLAAAAKIAKAAKFGAFTCATATGNDIAMAICAYAERNKYDHIVVGTAIRNELQRLILGSVSSGVVAKAPCPVTVVHK